jgi:DNA-binding LacI/PurR family transcriptional regulator
MPKHISAPSAHDVAHVAGVSQAAVSRAFTPGASIAKSTQEKVFRAAKSLGYRPNLLARSLIKGESGIVGVVIGSPRNPIFMLALDALSTRLSAAGKHILVFTADGNATADVHVEGLLKYRVDSVLLMAASLSAKMADKCREQGISIISFNRPPRNIKSFASVAGNNREGAEQIAAHLLQQGYRRPAFIAGFTESSTGREREAGFTDYLAAQGLPVPEREVGHCTREGALQATRHLLKRKRRPDAIFCGNDYMALAAMDVARYEFGLEIGREIGIAGFDDIEEGSWPSFELTTYSLPVEAMIDKVVAMLLTSPALKHSGHTLIKGTLKVRRSTQRSAK